MSNAGRRVIPRYGGGATARPMGDAGDAGGGGRYADGDDDGDGGGGDDDDYDKYDDDGEALGSGGSRKGAAHARGGGEGPDGHEGGMGRCERPGAPRRGNFVDPFFVSLAAVFSFFVPQCTNDTS